MYAGLNVTSLWLIVFQGFDEFMNVVVDDAAEIYVKEAKPRRELGALFRWCSEFQLNGCRPYLAQGRQYNTNPTSMKNLIVHASFDFP